MNIGTTLINYIVSALTAITGAYLTKLVGTPVEVNSAVAVLIGYFTHKALDSKFPTLQQVTPATDGAVVNTSIAAK